MAIPNIELSPLNLLYSSQKQLPRKMKSRLVIIECAGNNFWQLFLRRLYQGYLYMNHNSHCFQKCVIFERKNLIQSTKKHAKTLSNLSNKIRNKFKRYV